MPRKRKEEAQHRRIRPVQGSSIKTTHAGGWSNEYRHYCVQPGDQRPPEVSPPKEVGYNKTHGKERHEPATTDPELKRINELDWRKRRLPKQTQD